MDSKDQKQPDSFNDPINWKSVGFFSAEDYLIYVFKKTEKIVSALYLVSGLLKDTEPLKWELRDHGMDLISASFMASSSVPGDRSSVIQSIFTSALETMSILNIARVSNLISEMNFKLLIREIDQVLALLRDRLAQNAENAGYVLSESFFKTPDLFSTSAGGGFKGEGSKGQHFSSKISYRQASNSVGGTSSSQDKRTERQAKILALLKTQSGLTIKDFSRVIKDCSEKTIQRELLDLVEKGVITKEGERRWSTYSLK